MKAIYRNNYGSVDELAVRDVEDPVPGNDQVLIQVKAFGLNRAEIYMRKGLWGDMAPISGIECVGSVVEDPSGTLAAGQRVAALMGGMGRTINGSYAEYTCVPRSNVLPVETEMPWTNLAAIPESYLTAWTILHENLHIDNCRSLFVRGGTSALGQAAINIAVAKGVRVDASTRSRDKFNLLKQLGVAEVVMETPELSAQLRESRPDGVDAALDIVGNNTLFDTLKTVRKGGTVCIAGFLGGGDPVPFNPLFDMPSGVNLNFFASFMFGTAEFPLSADTLQGIVDNASADVYKCRPVQVFAFEDIRRAHELMESNSAGGKIVMEV